MIQVQDQALC